MPVTLCGVFPRIYRTCKNLGIDITREPDPGIACGPLHHGRGEDRLMGRHVNSGLFAAGEAACTGVHGANRLASNSLLEGLVYGERAGLGAARYARKHVNKSTGRRHDVVHAAHKVRLCSAALPDYRRSVLLSRKLMWEKVGIVRVKKDLTAALKQLKEWDRTMKGHAPDRNVFEIRNMITTALLITRSALQREGSVGAHFRSDFPTKGKNWRKENGDSEETRVNDHGANIIVMACL